MNETNKENKNTVLNQNRVQNRDGTEGQNCVLNQDCMQNMGCKDNQNSVHSRKCGVQNTNGSKDRTEKSDSTKDNASRKSRDQTDIREGSTSFASRRNKSSPVIDAEERVRALMCSRTNEQYRTEILIACRNCFETSSSRKEFAAQMKGVSSLVREISDTPAIDETFIQGAYGAFLSLGRWSE